MCFQNVRSVRNKTLYLNDHIATSNYDIMAICETWLTNTCELDDGIVNELLPNGYAIERVDRNNGETGGGLAMIYKTHLKVKLITQTAYSQFECIYGMFNIDNTPTNVFAIYRLPPTERNGLKTSDFLDEWRTFLSEQSTQSADLILVGDLNIHPIEPIKLLHLTV